MLSPNKVDEVKRLLATGRFSCRRISVRTGVSRAVVNRIANGTRREKPMNNPETMIPHRTGPVERCPRCGRKIVMPCLACLVRPRMLSNVLPLVLGVELVGEERRRYEQLRAAKKISEEGVMEGTLKNSKNEPGPMSRDLWSRS